MRPAPGDTRWVWFAVVSAAGSVIVATAVVAATGVIAEYSSSDLAAEFGLTALLASFLAVGALIALRRPGNPIGRLLIVAGWTWAVGFMLYALSAVVAQGGSVRAAGILEALTNAFATVWVPALAAVLLLFPDGKVPSSRWRWMRVAIWACAVTGFVAALSNGGWGGDVGNAIYANPMRDDLAPLGDIASAAFTGLMAVSVGGAAWAVVVRFRRSRGDERQQLKWVAFAAILSIGLVVVLAFLSEGAAASSLLQFAAAAITILVPVSIGIAVLKYRLYDIDHVIRRTATYAVVVAVLALLFTTSVVVLGNLVPVDSDLAVVVSTLAVFTLFAPLRRRVQQAIDRRFHRLPYDPDRVAGELVQRLRNETDLAAIRAACLETIGSTFQPVAASLWTRD